MQYNARFKDKNVVFNINFLFVICSIVHHWHDIGIGVYIAIKNKISTYIKNNS